MTPASTRPTKIAPTPMPEEQSPHTNEEICSDFSFLLKQIDSAHDPSAKMSALLVASDATDTATNVTLIGSPLLTPARTTRHAASTSSHAAMYQRLWYFVETTLKEERKLAGNPIGKLSDTAAKIAFVAHGSAITTVANWSCSAVP